MDAAVLDRFRLPGHYAVHAAVARGIHDDPRVKRINGVIPVLTRQINRFRAGLRPRERNNFEVDDVLQECWTELLLKDDYFDETRAKYITFATHIVHNKLIEIRNRWHIVAGPRDTAARLRDTDPSDPAAIERVRQTVREAGSLAAEPPDLCDNSGSPEEVARRAEQRGRQSEALQSAYRDLMRSDRLAGIVVGHVYGVGGREPLEIGRIADKFGITIAEVLTIKSQAEGDLRKRVAAGAARALLDFGVA